MVMGIQRDAEQMQGLLRELILYLPSSLVLLVHCLKNEMHFLQE